MSFVIKDDHVLDKCNGICGKIKEMLNIKFYSIPVYNEKQIKAKVREFNSVIKTNFSDDKIPKENIHHTCVACITIGSIMKMKKESSTSLFRRMQTQGKRNKNYQLNQSQIQSQSQNVTLNQKQCYNLILILNSFLLIWLLVLTDFE